MTKKKILSAGLACLLAMSLMACGEENASKSDDKTNSESSTSGKTITSVTQISNIDTSDMFTSRDKEIGYDTSSAVTVTLDGEKTSVSAAGAAYADGVLTISSEGTYIITGSLKGQIKVSVSDTEKVQLVLRDATITNESSAAIYVSEADKVFVTLEGTNSLDVTGEFVNSDDVNIDGAVFSKSDITFNGNGTLNVKCTYGHAIVSKDDLKVTGGTYVIDAGKDGLSGKDSVRIADGDFTITAGNDGIQSKNDDDAEKGYIYIEDGTFDIKTGGGSANASAKTDGFSGGFDRNGKNMGGFGQSTSEDSDSESAKAIKASLDINIAGGTFVIDSCDDAIHANSNVCIENASFTIASGDDGIHADASVLIQSGTIKITKSYEGIEGLNITVNGGDIELVSSDDGFNAAGGNDMSSMNGRPGQNAFDESSSAGDVYLRIAGGNITVNADGDGLDSNGTLFVSGGTIYVYGPTNSGNGALDYDSNAQITGGTIMAFGYGSMAQNFGSNSTQGSILYNISATAAANTKVTLKDSSGKELVSAVSPKTFNSVVISTPDITSNGTYTLTIGSSDYEITMSGLIYGNGGSMGGQGGKDMNGGFSPQMPGGNMERPTGAENMPNKNKGGIDKEMIPVPDETQPVV